MHKTRMARATAMRTQIVEAAAGLFAVQGVEATSLRQIARAAAVSTGSIFAAWKGKDELVALAVARDRRVALRVMADGLAQVRRGLAGLSQQEAATIERALDTAGAVNHG